MPRRSSGGRSARPAPRPASARGPPPQPVNRAPPPAPVQSGSGGSILGGIGSTIAQGMAFGTGSAVAHRAVDAVMGPRTIQHETVVSEAAAAPASAAPSMGGSDACSVHTKAFQDCLNSYGNDISKCQFYMDMLAECRRSSAASSAPAPNPGAVSSSILPSMHCGPPPAPAESGSRSSSVDKSIIAPIVELGTAITAVANRAVDAVLGRPRTNIQYDQEAVVSGAAALTIAPSRGIGSDNADANCSVHSKAFQDCLNSSEFDDMGKCQIYMDVLAHCRRNSSS